MANQTMISEEEATEICERAGVPFDVMAADFKVANDVGYYHGRDALDWFTSCVQEFIIQSAQEHGTFAYDIRYGTPY
jgi:hypothetical protein